MDKSICELQNEFLSLINTHCAENCKIAQAKARQAGQCVLNGGSHSEVMFAFVEAAANCTGPQPLKVCGGETFAEDSDEVVDRTYNCNVLEKLGALSFVEFTSD